MASTLARQGNKTVSRGSERERFDSAVTAVLSSRTELQIFYLDPLCSTEHGYTTVSELAHSPLLLKLSLHLLNDNVIFFLNIAKYSL